MAVSGVLNNILKAHAGSFDIKENINIENRTFSAYFQSDWDLYQSRVQKDKEGNIFNPITLKGVTH